MTGRVSDDKIAEIRDRASLREIVSRYVALKPSGRNFVGLCPFHAEKTPSFSVSDERGFFHCFGCGASGDVFKLLMRLENLTFPEALERLARELGVELPRRPEEAQRREGRERLLQVNEAAAEFFQRCLWKEPSGEIARAYLRKRELTEATARAFRLGYAPPEGLARSLQAARNSLEDAETLGLVARSQRGGWYDRFRTRLIFPIADLGGGIIAFGGRVLGEASEGQPKYLNSPESPLFQKRRSLFGLSAARDPIRSAERSIVVEGYVDVIALAQAGIGNVVAPLGTALTADQVRLLRRFTDGIVVLFDGDAAGQAAAVRSFPVFAEVGLFADAAFLPEGQDPDTFVRSAGREAVERLVANAAPLVDHYLRSLALPDAPLSRRMRAAEAVAELLGRIGNPIFGGLFARRAAEHLGIAEDQLWKRKRSSESAERTASPPDAPPTPGADFSRQESLILELLLVHPLLRHRIDARTEQLFSSDAARALLRRVLEETATAESLVEELPTAARDRVARALLGESEIYGQPEQMLQDTLARLERDERERRLRSLAREIREAEGRGDPETLQRLLVEKQKLVRGETS